MCLFHLLKKDDGCLSDFLVAHYLCLLAKQKKDQVKIPLLQTINFEM